ncbi:DHA1 family tetracycline resistance protein-like MFS transporter [Thermosporothrix hazakensis]|uniref:DHA1 family tetracycline resistance protein-like MFS transporter n=2 Tax=Thermosporothrix TaxID=768650 RepID=A0A326U3V1_THEHA|nr:MFS transporter [Thermosporothrix hazakensis]PZW27118.1 DHA1 family tetracycline resistance protein-like MFS transporter [Thermosporothrix hazakensis]BBH87987.1 tetracycline resistance MFS efflux pump [Thermosporothrix sp. COM3]GCE50401.1 tetracycline resistance MFS efflux pump [Thermosporothrix hazakensis]
MHKSVRSTNSNTPVGRMSLVLLLVIALLNTMGMTIIIPLVPFLTLQYLAHPTNLAVIMGWLTAVYGICQLIAAPVLGVLSDRFGRRPILFICLLGSAFGYLIFGLGGALWLLFLGRIIDGLTGGNISILFGYIADITEPQARGKYFGWLGAAASIGSLMGPAVGGLLATLNDRAPFLVAAGLLLLTLVWGYFLLPESLDKEHRITSISVSELNPLKQLVSAFRWANVRWLLLAWFLYALPVSMLQTTLTVLMKDCLGFNATQAGLVVTLVGAVDILVQGVLVGWFLAMLGNIRLGLIAFVLVGISYLILGSIAFFATPLLLLVGVMLFAGSGSLVENALRGLISEMVGRHEQGRVSGATQSLQSLGWVVGPLLGGFVYTAWGPFQAYASASFSIVLAMLCLWIALPLLRRRKAKEQTYNEQEASEED